MEAQEFGARLRELREQAGLTQRELAGKVNIDFTYLSKIENGVLPPPSEKVILQLAEVLNADKDELITLAGRIPSDIAQMLKSRETLQFLRSDRFQKKVGASSKRGEGIHLIKYFKSVPKVSIPLKSLSKVAIPLVLVLAVATSLWFAAPVKAVEITIDNPSSGTLGRSYPFTVKVDISDPELIPIQSVDLYIFENSAYTVNNSPHKATCTDLPLTATTKTYPSGETGGGAVSITATVSNWGWGYGYGYAAWEGTPYYFGYGYGYGAGIASITYDVDWTSPSGWPESGYKAEVQLTANATTFTQTSSEFTLSERRVYVAPPVVPAPGVTDVSDSVDEQGNFTETVVAESEDGKVELSIDEGTTGLIDGEPVSEISIQPIEPAEQPPEPEDTNVIGLPYEVGPPGTTFTDPVTICFTYSDEDVPTGVDEQNLALARWDGSTWVELQNITVNPATNTICGTTTELSPFAILAYTHPAVFAASDLTITPAEVDIGQTVTISALVTNTGDLADSYEVTLKIDDVTVATEEVTLAGNASQRVTFTTAKDVPDTYTVTVDSLSGTFTVKAPPVPPVPAAFTASDLTVTPAEVDIGQTVTISVLVANTGDLTGSYEVTLKIDDVTVATEEVTLVGGASQKVTFTTAKDVPGTYTVTVDTLSGTFTVKAPPVPPKPWWVSLWWIWVIVGVVVVGVVVWMVLRRRRV